MFVFRRDALERTLMPDAVEIRVPRLPLITFPTDVDADGPTPEPVLSAAVEYNAAVALRFGGTSYDTRTSPPLARRVGRVRPRRENSSAIRCSSSYGTLIVGSAGGIRVKSAWPELVSCCNWR